MHSWQNYVWVAVGGGVGSVARVAAGVWVSRTAVASPALATLAVNVTGSFLIGVLAAFAAAGGRLGLGPAGQSLLMAGFCGGFTTFSAFSLQTLEALRERTHGLVWLNVLASVVLCLLAVTAGLSLGQALGGRR